jgi:uncharacterized protein (DUF305 family)
MNTNSLLFGIVGFLLGGLLVSIAAVTFDKPNDGNDNHTQNTKSMQNMGMDEMAQSMQGKTGDAFDKAFIDAMIVHHQGAIEMAEMAELQAKHQEIKQLSNDIITAQTTEITQMQQWLKDWGYGASSSHMHAVQ